MEKKIISVVFNTTRPVGHSRTPEEFFRSIKRLEKIWEPNVIIQFKTHFGLDPSLSNVLSFMKPDDLDNNTIWVVEFCANDPWVGRLSEFGSCYCHRTFSPGESSLTNRIPSQLHSLEDRAKNDDRYLPAHTLQGICEHSEEPVEEITRLISICPMHETLLRIYMVLTVLQEASRLEGQNAPKSEIVENGNTDEYFDEDVDYSLEEFEIAIHNLKKTLLGKIYTFGEGIARYICLKHEFETDPYYKNLDNSTEKQLFFSPKIGDIKIPSQYFDHEDFLQTLNEYEISFHKMFVTIACELDTRIRNAAEYPYILSRINNACLSAISAIETLRDVYLPLLIGINKRCEMIKTVTAIKGRNKRPFTTWIRMVMPDSIQTYSKAIDVWVKNIEYTYELFTFLQSLISTQIPLDEKSGKIIPTNDEIGESFMLPHDFKK